MRSQEYLMKETVTSAVTRSVVVHSQLSTQPESYHVISDEQPKRISLFLPTDCFLPSNI